MGMTIGGREWLKWCGHEGRAKAFERWQRLERSERRARDADTAASRRVNNVSCTFDHPDDWPCRICKAAP